MILNLTFVLKKTTLMLVFNLLCLVCVSQNSFKKSFESNLSYGRILPHRSTLKGIILKNSYSFEASLNFHTDGKKTYHYYYNFPTFSWTIHHTSSGNSKSIGSIIASYGSVNIPLSKRSNPLFIKLCFGAGWIEKKFDLESNFKNIAIGSNLNFNLQIKFEKIFYSLKNKYFKYGVLLNHFSNGSFKRPNLGINIFQMQASYSFGIKRQYIDTTYKNFKNLNKKNLCLYNVSAFKEVSTGSEKSFYINETAIQFEYRKNIKSSLNSGIDVLYNSSVKPSTKKNLQIGATFGHTLNIGNLKLITLIGCHIYNKDDIQRRIYNKINIDYLITKKISSRISLRSHLFTADFVGIGFGYKLF